MYYKSERVCVLAFGHLIKHKLMSINNNFQLTSKQRQQPSIEFLILHESIEVSRKCYKNFLKYLFKSNFKMLAQSVVQIKFKIGKTWLHARADFERFK